MPQAIRARVPALDDDRFFAPEAETWGLYRSAPAAKFFHQAYRHGLLELAGDARLLRQRIGAAVVQQLGAGAGLEGDAEDRDHFAAHPARPQGALDPRIGDARRGNRVVGRDVGHHPDAETRAGERLPPHDAWSHSC